MKTLHKWVLCAVLAFFGSTGWGQAPNVYNKFSPATGILKGTSTSYFTSAAAWSDVKSLLTGTCDVTTFVKGDGSCAAASLTPPGSNTQVIYNSSGSFGASSLLTFNSGSDVLNIGASTTPGTFSVGSLDSMVINGVSVPIPSFAANSNIQGVFENHSYVNGVTSGGARYYGVRAEGTISSPLIVANGDHLSTFYAAGYNGTNYSLGGDILFQVNGTPSASAMPTDLLFQLSPSGSQVPATVLTLAHDTSATFAGPAVFQSPTGNQVTINAVSGPALESIANGTANSLILTASGNATNGALNFNFDASGNPFISNGTVNTSINLNGNTGATALVVNPAASTTGIAVVAPLTATASISLRGNNNAGAAAGVVSQDASSNVHLANSGAADVDLDTNGVNRIAVKSTGGVLVGSPTGGDKGAGTINAVGLYVGGVAVGTGGGTPGGTSGQIQFNNAGAFGGISTNGTGNVVLDTSPTLTTPNLGTPSAINLTNATALPLSALANQGTTTTVLHGNAAGNPSFGAVGLTTDVTGILPAANGGNGNGFFAVSGPATSTKTFTFPNASATVLTSNAAVTVAQGGTGLASLTAHDLLIGAGTSNATLLAPSATSGVALISQGSAADPAYGAINLAGGSSIVTGTLPVGNGGTGTTTPAIAAGTGIGVSGTWPNQTVSLSTPVSVANGGTGVTSSTGTGSVVLSASPAFTGSPTIGGNNICLSTGTNCPGSAGFKFAGGLITTSGGTTCTVNTNLAALASCTESAVGRPVINFTTSYFTTTFVCTATSLSSNLSQVVNLNGINLNSIQAYITQSGSNVDSSLNIMCFGT